jgi:hypothetical protein
VFPNGKPAKWNRTDHRKCPAVSSAVKLTRRPKYSRRRLCPHHDELDLTLSEGALQVGRLAGVDEEAEPARDAVAGSHVPLAVRQQHDLAEHSAFAQHLVRAARLFERQTLRDQGLDLALFQQVQ